MVVRTLAVIPGARATPTDSRGRCYRPVAPGAPALTTWLPPSCSSRDMNEATM
jgi:hypothetical protein